eukprot:1183667-Prorocentrum_minimum.AAC.2
MRGEGKYLHRVAAPPHHLGNDGFVLHRVHGAGGVRHEPAFLHQPQRGVDAKEAGEDGKGGHLDAVEVDKGVDAKEAGKDGKGAHLDAVEGHGAGRPPLHVRALADGPVTAAGHVAQHAVEEVVRKREVLAKV